MKFDSKQRKMDIQNEYLDIQLCDKHLIYSVAKFRSSAVISDIFILTYFNISDIKAEYSDITIQYLDIRTEYIRCLSHIVEYSFFSVN